MNCTRIPSIWQRNLVTIPSQLAPKTQNLYNQLVKGDRASLARTITLVESTLKTSKAESRKLISMIQKNCQSQIKASFRIGLSGPPGAGKSTFIEVFGHHLISCGLKVAVLAIDPSSTRTGGSLLGDKTRMTELSRNPKAYIRGSPNRGYLGGVARTTNESILLCEAAGYDVVLIETVGVGQSEYLVADMVDALCLILPPAGGDELQGIKRGIVEQCDAVVINKCDGDLIPAANRVAAEYTSALKFMPSKSKHWRTKVLKISSKTNQGIENTWQTLQKFKETMIENNAFYERRSTQQKAWMWQYIQHKLIEAFRQNPDLHKKHIAYEALVSEGSLNPGVAADLLLADFWKKDMAR